MNIPRNLVGLLDSIYYGRYSRYTAELNNRGLLINKVVVEDDTSMLIPPAVLREVRNRLSLPEKPDVIVTKWDIVEGANTTRKSANSIVYNLIGSGYTRGCRSESGIQYYGNSSFIAKEEGDSIKPLMMPMMEAHINTASDGRPSVVIDNIILLVDKAVFTDGDLVSNFIMKKAIPFFTNRQFSTGLGSPMMTVEARILDVSKYLMNVPLPSKIVDKNEIYTCLNPV